MASPNLLDQGIQTRNHSLLLNPFNADLPHVRGAMNCRENSQPGSTPETQEHCVNGYEASSDKPDVLGQSRLLTLHSPRLLQVSNRVFSKTPCWPRGPGAHGSGLTSNSSLTRETLLWCGVRLLLYISKQLFMNPAPLPHHFLPDLELRHQHLL